MTTKLWIAGVCVGLMGAAPAAQAQINGAGGTFVGAQGAGGGSGGSLDVGASVGAGVNTGNSGLNVGGLNVGGGLNATTTPATTTPGSMVNIRGNAAAQGATNPLSTRPMNTRPSDMRGYGAGVMGDARIDGLGTGSIYTNTGVGADVRQRGTGASVGAGAATEGRVNR